MAVLGVASIAPALPRIAETLGVTAGEVGLLDHRVHLSRGDADHFRGNSRRSLWPVAHTAAGAGPFCRRRCGVFIRNQPAGSHRLEGAPGNRSVTHRFHQRDVDRRSVLRPSADEGDGSQRQRPLDRNRGLPGDRRRPRHGCLVGAVCPLAARDTCGGTGVRGSHIAPRGHRADLREYFGGLWDIVRRREVLALFFASTAIFILALRRLRDVSAVSDGGEVRLVAFSRSGLVMAGLSISTAVTSANLGRLAGRFGETVVLRLGFAGLCRRSGADTLRLDRVGPRRSCDPARFRLCHHDPGCSGAVGGGGPCRSPRGGHVAQRDRPAARSDPRPANNGCRASRCGDRCGFFLGGRFLRCCLRP